MSEREVAEALAGIVKTGFENLIPFVNAAIEEMGESPLLDVISEETVQDMDAIFASLDDEGNERAWALRRELQMLIVISVDLATQVEVRGSDRRSRIMQQFRAEIMTYDIRRSWGPDDIPERFRSYSETLTEKNANLGLRFDMFFNGGEVVIEEGGIIRAFLAQSVFKTFFDQTRRLLANLGVS